MASVLLYTISGCQNCRNAENFLAKNGISYFKIELDKQQNKLEEFKHFGRGFSGVPLLVLVRDNGSAVTVRGFNPREIEKVLKITNPPKVVSN